MPSQIDSDGWTVVTGSRGKAKPLSAKAQTSHTKPSQSAQNTNHVSKDRIIKVQAAINSAVVEIQSSQFYTSLLPILESSGAQNAKSLVVYGLGSLEQPGAVHIRYQVALAQILCTLLQPKTSVAFDPVFSALDRQILPLFNLEILQVNENGRRIAQCPTLFFMPHCEAELTDNLLTANREAGTLHNVWILGNSFQEYRERWQLRPNSNNSIKPETLLDICASGKVVEIKVNECGFPVTSAFNDLSMHYFPNSYS